MQQQEDDKMYKNTNIEVLGTEYSIADAEGNVLKSIQVIPHTEILEAALGPYTDAFGSYQTYLDNSIAVLSGFEGIDKYTVMWYATLEEEVVLAEIIEYAVSNGYDKIILEHLDVTE
jgi:hypothetical protein